MSRDTNPMVGHCRFADEISSQILEHFGKPSKIIELGCGRGGNLAKFIDSVVRVGVEPHEGNATKAKESLKGARIINKDHRYLSRFSVNQFDVGYTCSVLDHMENFEFALSDLCRISKRVMLFEPVIKGKSRQATPKETNCWRISWYHDLEAWLNKQSNIKFTCFPKILYESNSGLKFYQFIINSESYTGGRVFSPIFESHKGKAINSRLSICEVHREIYDILVLNLQDKPNLLIQIFPLLEVAFAQGISVVHKLIEYKLTTTPEIKERIPPISDKARKLREDRKRLMALEKKLRGMKESLKEGADYV